MDLLLSAVPVLLGALIGAASSVITTVVVQLYQAKQQQQRVRHERVEARYDKRLEACSALIAEGQRFRGSIYRYEEQHGISPFDDGTMDGHYFVEVVLALSRIELVASKSTVDAARAFADKIMRFQGEESEAGFEASRSAFVDAARLELRSDEVDDPK